MNLGKIESNKKSPIGIVGGLSTNLSFNTSNSVKINLKISHLQKAPSVVEKLLNLFEYKKLTSPKATTTLLQRITERKSE